MQRRNRSVHIALRDINKRRRNRWASKQVSQRYVLSWIMYG